MDAPSCPATIAVQQARIDAQAGLLSMEEVLDLLDALAAGLMAKEKHMTWLPDLPGRKL
jgi:hypothetical protein